jgi:hypothetical protein
MNRSTNTARVSAWDWRLILAAVVVFAAALNRTNAAPSEAIRTIALTGQQAPDAPTGAQFQYFVLPQLNNAGDTAFQAGLVGGGVDDTNAAGIWSDSSGSWRVIARQGSHAPGTPEGVRFGDPVGPFNVFLSLALNDAGQTAFLSRLIGSGALLDEGIWIEGASGPELIAREGGRAPGTPDGVTLRTLDSYSISLNNAGQIAFGSFLSGDSVNSSNAQVIWSGDADTLRPVARTGSHAPGTPAGVNFESFALYSRIGLDDAGQTAFLGYLTGTGVNDTNQSGIWMERAGNLTLVARSGDPAANGPGATNFAGFYPPIVNEAGQLAFQAGLSGRITSLNDRGIWSGAPDQLVLKAQKGMRAAGLPVGVNYSSFNEYELLLNDAGRIAFTGYVTGLGINDSNAEGLWAETSNGLHLIARRSDHAPGTPDGVRFGEPGFWAFSLTGFNDAGQVAFVGTLDGPNVDFTNNVGIWATDQTGALRLIARSGDVLEVAPGDVRTVSFLFLASNSLNNLGQLIFEASFTDGTRGLFVSNHVAIPEPGSLLILACALTSMVVLRRNISARSCI